MLSFPQSRLARRRTILALVGILLLCVVLLTAGEAVHLKGVVTDLQRGGQLARESATELGQPQQWDPQRIAKARDLNVKALALVGPADTRIHNDRALGLLESVRPLREETKAAGDLADALLNASRAETDLIAIAQMYVDMQRTATGPVGPRLLALLGQATPLVTHADDLLQPALQKLREDLARSMVAPLRNQVASALKTLQPVADSVALLRVMSATLPAAIGATGSRTYLLLLENPSELRPTGGLAGYLGPLTIVNGEPINLTLKGTSFFTPKQCFPVPVPLGYYLTFSGNCLDISDAGWSPDFPTSIQLIERMYASATAKKVDGTIAIDPYAVAQILKVVGPVSDPVYGEFNSENFFPKTNIITNVKLDGGVIQSIGSLILAKLTTLPLASWPVLLESMNEQSRGRHIQLFVHDPSLARSIAQAHFDGSVLNGGAEDYLMIVDANMIPGKADYFITKTVDAMVEIYASGLNRHQVIVHLDYPKPLVINHDDTFLNASGKYIDYVRIYLPETANVSSIVYKVDGRSTALSLGEVTHEFGKTVVGVTIILDRGHKGDLSFLYSDALKPGTSYSLLVQKQAGIPDRPTKLEVSYPGGIAHREASLTTDAEFSVQW